MTVTEPVYEQPYHARLIIGHLLADDDVTADVGDEVGTDISASRLPAIRVTQFPGRPVSGSTLLWLTEHLLQLDCYWDGGSDRYNAHMLAIKAQRALMSLKGSVSYTIGGEPATGVVTGIEVMGIADTYDTAFEHPKPISRFDVMLTAHPLPGSGS